ncbi:MAG: uroporphyrinogen-III C-methyltransferase [Algicola sp.]|nr:uroporphyrinogen-III C-methyltransferase [Algicola sp.]
MSNNQTPQHGSPGTELEAIEQDMAEVEKLETPNKSDEPVEKTIEDVAFEQAPQQQESTPKKVKKGGGLVVGLALLLSLISLTLIGGAYWFWQKNQALEQQKVQQWQGEQIAQLQRLEQQLTKQVTDQLASGQSQMQTRQQRAEKGVTQRLIAMDARLGEVSGRQPNDWTLAEASYLVRIAGRKLWLEDDIETAQSLLVTADLRVMELSDPSLYPLRASIAQDIAALRALPNPRVTDIHLNLSGLIKNIDTLTINTIEIYTDKPRPVKEAVTAAVATDKAANTSVAEPTMLDTFLNSMDNLASKLFYVNHGIGEGDIQPLKMPRQQWYLRANLKMALLQAQVAILSRDEVVFRDTVSRAIEWLGMFKQTDSAVQAATLTLSSLLKDPLKADYPKQFVSQKVLERLIQERLGKAASLPASLSMKAVPVKTLPVKKEAEAKGETP